MRTIMLVLALASLSRGDSVPERVYERLVRASGDRRTPPTLVVESDSARRKSARGVQVAWFDPGKRIIGIDRKTLGICAAMKEREPDCIAVFLGHELAHFYRDHGWASDFGSRFAGLAVASNVANQRETAEQRTMAEAQADELGGMYGYLAGFDTFGVAPDALAAVYGAYAVAANARGYPSLRDRQAMAERAARNVQRLLPVFEAGNILAALGYYLPAAQCYDFIAQTFPSREILNNAGVAYALAAAQRSPERDLLMAYPWSLDGQTRMRPHAPPAVRGDPDPDKRYPRWMAIARERLESATERDPGYAAALINLASVEDIGGRANAAVDSATRAIDLLEGNHSPYAGLGYISRAIAYLHLKQAEKARADLSRAGDERLRAFWESVAGGAVPRVGQLVRRSVAPPRGDPETIGDIGTELPSRNAQMIIVPASPDAGPKLTIQWSTVNGGRLISVSTDNLRLNTVRTPQRYAGKTAKGVGVGAAVAEVRDAYGHAVFSSRLLPDAWLLYDQARIVFLIDPADRVSGWLIFDVKQTG